MKFGTCPCGSSRNPDDCCFASGFWHKPMANVLPKPPITGYSHPKCYASSIGDCSNKLCREHYISQNVLKQVAKSGTVMIAGFPWQESEIFDSLSPSAIVSRVLCIRHGESLSPLDAEFGRFFRALEEVDDALRDGKSIPAHQLFAGEDLERWMLKMLLGTTAANIFSSHLKGDCLPILYGQRDWPDQWGLYLATNLGNTIYHSDSLRIETKVDAKNSQILLTEFGIRGLPFRLCLGRLGAAAKLGVYRPRRIQFTAVGNKSITLELSWRDQSLQQLVNLQRTSAYDGPPPDWSDWERR